MIMLFDRRKGKEIAFKTSLSNVDRVREKTSLGEGYLSETAQYLKSMGCCEALVYRVSHQSVLIF